MITLGIDIDYQQTPLQLVRYLVDGQEVATAVQPPFTAAWHSILPSGAYSLVAVATDQSQAEARTPSATITLVRATQYPSLPLWALFGGGAVVFFGMYGLRRVLKRKAKGDKKSHEPPLLSLLDVGSGIPVVDLIVETSSGQVIESSFKKTSIRLGSDSRWVDFSIREAGIMPIHLTLWHREHGLFIEPHNVVYVNDQPVNSQIPMQDGMRIKVGSVSLSIRETGHTYKATPVDSTENKEKTEMTMSISERVSGSEHET